MNIPVKLVDWGLANNFGTHIELHRDLPHHPDLAIPILRHEYEHTDKAFSWKDFTLDLRRNKGINYIKLYSFMIRRPKTWVQFLPVYYMKDKGLVYDLNLLIIYGLMLASLAVVSYSLLVMGQSW